jgi:hypothetical protein
MPEPISTNEKTGIESIATGLSNTSLIDGLQYLLKRETVLLEQSDMGEGEARDITLHNIALLVSAITRITSLAEIEEQIIEEALKE